MSNLLRAFFSTAFWVVFFNQYAKNACLWNRWPDPNVRIVPPYNKKEDEKATGTSIDMMEQMLGLIDTDLSRERITILIWAHSYRALQKTPGSVLFVVTRTLERENFFNGLAPSRRKKCVAGS